MPCIQASPGCWGPYGDKTAKVLPHRVYILIEWRQSINKQVNTSIPVALSGLEKSDEGWWVGLGGGLFYMGDRLWCGKKPEGNWNKSGLFTSLRALSTILVPRLFLLCPVLTAVSVSVAQIKCWQTKHFNRKCSLLGMMQEGSIRRNLPLQKLNGFGFIEHCMGILGGMVISQM